METKNKNRIEIASTTSQEPETGNSLTKEQQNHADVTRTVKNTKATSPSPQNQADVTRTVKNTKATSSSPEGTPSLNQQYPSVLQWSYPTPHAEEQSTSKSSWLPTQKQSLDLSFNPAQLSPHLAQPGVSFWLPQRTAYPFSGLSSSANFAGWQALHGGGNSSRNQTQFPSSCYHIGYPFPGFPSPWDPSYWWAQSQQSQPSCTTLPGPHGYFSSPPLPPPVSGCPPQVQSSEKGIIRTTMKLSQKHQQLWEAQSAENVQLWNVICQLQSQVADYKIRLTKLEAEVSFLKPRVEEPAADQPPATGLSAQPSKRRRPKRSVASGDVQPPRESYPRARGRKLASSKLQLEARTITFEKVRLNKVEGREKICHPIATLPQQKNGINPDTAINFNDNNLTMSLFNNQTHHRVPGIQKSGIGIEEEAKAEILKPSVSIMSQQAANGNHSATYVGPTSTASLGIWPSSIHSEEAQRNISNLKSQGFYDNSSLIRQGGRKAGSSWSFVNSEELEDIAVGSGKEENEEEMEDDDSSTADEMAHQKDESAYNMDGVIGNSPKVLPQFNNW